MTADRFARVRYAAAADHVKDAAVSIGEALDLLPDYADAAKQLRSVLIILNPAQAFIRQELDHLQEKS